MFFPSARTPFFELIKNMSTRNSQHTIDLLVEPLRVEIGLLSKLKVNISSALMNIYILYIILDSMVNPETEQFQNRLLFLLCSIRSACFEMNIFDHLADFLICKFTTFSKG